MIYSIAEIKVKLDNEFLPLEDKITGLRLIENYIRGDDINNFEQKLDIRLPTSFKNLISKFDFGNFSINNIEFGYQENYLKRLDQMNLAINYNPWWQGKFKPNNIIAIATSDPYTILLNCDNGYIYALLSDDKWLDWRMVSFNFEIFLRAIGTIYLHSVTNQDFSQHLNEVIDVTHSTDKLFWRSFIL